MEKKKENNGSYQYLININSFIYLQTEERQFT